VHVERSRRSMASNKRDKEKIELNIMGRGMRRKTQKRKTISQINKNVENEFDNDLSPLSISLI